MGGNGQKQTDQEAYNTHALGRHMQLTKDADIPAACRQSMGQLLYHEEQDTLSVETQCNNATHCADHGIPVHCLTKQNQVVTKDMRQPNVALSSSLVSGKQSGWTAIPGVSQNLLANSDVVVLVHKADGA